MKLQNIAINNRFGHAIDYDSNNNFVENFVVEGPNDGDSIPLIAFCTNNDTSNAFIIETDQKSESMFLEQAELSLDEKIPLNILNVSLKFSNLNSTSQSTSAKTQSNIFTPNTPAPATQTRALVEQIITQLDGKVALSWSDRSTSGKKVLMLDMLDLNQSNLKVIVKFTLELHGKLKNLKTKTIHIYVAPKKAIVDVLLDFGSEATQMTVYARNEDIDISGFSELFTNIKECLVKGQEAKSKDEDYYQFDASSKKLFRSHLFLKKNITENEVKIALNDSSVATRDNLLKALITKSDVQNEEFKRDYFASPNVKLASYGGIDLPKVQVDGVATPTNRVGGSESYFFYRSSISLFIQQGLKAAIHKGPNILFVSFHFLMPNVYKQNDIVAILRALQQDISGLLKKEEYDQLKGFEVTAISESDASVMGVLEFLRSENNTPGVGNYLLLDAGKGTLDFSLVRYEYDHRYHHTYTNLWRSGIIGAGNSITYAYLLALLHQYLQERYDGTLTEALLQQFIYRNILGEGEGKPISGTGDAALLLNLMRTVDQYKVFSSIQKEDVRRKEDVKATDLDKFILEGFITWLEEGVDISKGRVQTLTHSEYVEKMIAALVNESINRIMEMQQGRDESIYKIDYIIFAGRAFNHAPFKAAMYKAITQLFDGTEIQFMNENAAVSMKDICLVCVNPIRMGNYNRKILSLPVLIQKNNNASMANSKSKKNQQSSFLKRLLNRLFGTNNNEEISQDTSQSTVTMITDIKRKVNTHLNSYTSVDTPADQTGLKGADLTVMNSQYARINIGGVIYPLNGVGNGIINVYFNGEEYKVRYNGQMIDFNALMQFGTSSFLQSSFFPNFKPANQSAVELVPCINCEWTANADTEFTKKAGNEDDLSKRPRKAVDKTNKTNSITTESVSDKEEAELKEILSNH